MKTLLIINCIIYLIAGIILSSCSSVNSDWSELNRRAENSRIQEYKNKNQNDKSFDVKFLKHEF